MSITGNICKNMSNTVPFMIIYKRKIVNENNISLYNKSGSSCIKLCMIMKKS